MTKILVIEDERQIRDEVMDWLQFEGYEVTGAANGRLGLEAAIRDIPDMIVCDIAMPEMDGHRVLLEVRSNPRLLNVPFVFLTASASHDSVRKGMDMGADDYLTKPFTHAEVMNAIRSRLEKKIARDNQTQEHMSILNSSLSAEREKLQLKSRLVAMFSHDFRNPLTSILSSNDLLRTYGTHLVEERKQLHYDRIEGSVRLLLQMLDDMLMIAQLESGHLEYTPSLIDISSYLESIVNDFRLISGETHSFSYFSEVLTTVEIDQKLFRQIATNLISNAVKYSASGSEIKVTLTENKDQLELVVQDKGIGIPEEDLPHLFEAFYRGSNAGEVKGTGLGLANVKQAVEIHKGSIKVQSEVAKGTRIIVQFPRIV
jgi:signal transduction histidine kinase